jgi:hypothetical protein
MNRSLVAGICLSVLGIAVAVGATASANAQRHKVGVVHNLEATLDRGVAHPAAFSPTGPGTITCVRAFSDVPNSKPAPTCKITANGFNGTMAVNSNATLKTGEITLSCTGPGSLVRCDARVDIAPAQP